MPGIYQVQFSYRALRRMASLHEPDEHILITRWPGQDGAEAQCEGEEGLVPGKEGWAFEGRGGI